MDVTEFVVRVKRYCPLSAKLVGLQDFYQARSAAVESQRADRGYVPPFKESLVNCCQCQGIEKFFNEKVAAKELKAYRSKGPGKTSQMLIDAIKREGLQGMTLLDIGGGIGKIQHELMDAGASHTTAVDASKAYLAASREEAIRRGHADRAEYLHGNFVDVASQVAEADVVTLDRVVCCFPDMKGLVGLSAVRARRFYGLVYPRDTWWLKIGFRALNLVMKFVYRCPFRGYVHPTADVEAEVRSRGLNRFFQRHTLIWQVVLYRR